MQGKVLKHNDVVGLRTVLVCWHQGFQFFNFACHMTWFVTCIWHLTNHIRHVTCAVWHVTRDTSHLTCHMWQVKCDMSHLTCHMWQVKCDVSRVTCHTAQVTCLMWFVKCHIHVTNHVIWHAKLKNWNPWCQHTNTVLSPTTSLCFRTFPCINFTFCSNGRNTTAPNLYMSVLLTWRR